MRMKKYIIIMAAAVLAAACAKEMPGEAGQDRGLIGGSARHPLTFTADIVSTRTTLGADWNVSWNDGDAVKIVWNGGSATTSAVIDGGKVSFSASVDEVNDYYAVYPASFAASVGADGKLSVTVPSVQDGRFENCAAIVAHTTRESLDFGRFRSAVSLIRFQLDDASLTRISFSDPSGAKVAGRVSTGPDCASFDTDAGSGTIEAGLSGAGPYYLALVPGLDLGGLAFQLGTADAWKGVSSNDTPVSLSAGDVLCVNGSVDGHIEVLGDYYITVGGSGSKDGSSKANAGDAAFLRSLLSSAGSGSLLDGRIVHIASGTYDMAIGDKRLSLSFDSPAAVTLEGEEGTVFTTSLSGDEGCILTVASAGVSLDIRGISFTGASHNGPGGAVCLNEGSHSFTDCSFYDNEVTSKTSDHTGGAVYLKGSATADFSHCSFTRNKTAITGGGAIGIHSSGIVRILGCRFTQNGILTVANGGAILQKGDDSYLYVAGCAFDSNSCTNNGPDIFTSKGSALLLYNCTSVNPGTSNTTNAGSIRANAPMLVANCTFSIPSVSENNGCVAFGNSGEAKNRIINNLVLCDEGNSFSSAFTASNTSQKRDVASFGFNVYTKAPNITWKGDGVSADKTGVSYSSVFPSAAALSAGGVLEWDGPAAKLDGFTCAGADDVSAAIKGYAQNGNDFYNWLVDTGAFDVDGAGNYRGTAAWWPGAYQKAE